MMMMMMMIVTVMIMMAMVKMINDINGHIFRNKGYSENSSKME